MKTDTRHNRIRIWLYWALFAFVALSFAYLLVSDPLTGDDTWTARELRDYIFSSDGNLSLHEYISGLISVYDLRFTYDISRMANYVPIALMTLPAWIASAIAAISFAGALLLLARFAGIRRGEWQKMSWLLFFIVFGELWYDNMFCIMFAYNYIVASFVMLAGMFVFLHEKPVKIWVAIVAGLVAGSWHESNTAILIAGCIGVFILHRDMIRSDKIAFFAAVVIGSLLIFLAPSFGKRIEIIARHREFIRFLYMWVYILFLIICVVCMSKKRWRHLLVHPFIIFCIVSGALGIIVFLTPRIRAVFPAIFLAAGGIIYLTSNVWCIHSGKKTIPFTAISLTVMLLTVVHLAALCHRASIFRDDFLHIQQALDLDNRLEQTNIIFVDVTLHSQSTPLAMGLPDKRAFNPYGISLYHMEEYNRPVMNPVAIIPEDFKNITKTQGKSVKSNRDVRIINGFLVSSDTFNHPTTWTCISYGNHVESTDCFTQPFISTDGYIYHYLLPVRSTLAEYLGDPTELYFYDK